MYLGVDSVYDVTQYYQFDAQNGSILLIVIF